MLANVRIIHNYKHFYFKLVILVIFTKLYGKIYVDTKARITKHFKARFSKTLVLVKSRVKYIIFQDFLNLGFY